MKTNRIPFSLEKYESGKYKVVTKNGRKARIICTDFKSDQPIIAIVEEENDKESFSDFALDGKLWIGGRVSNTDLYLEETVFEDGDIVTNEKDYLQKILKTDLAHALTPWALSCGIAGTATVEKRLSLSARPIWKRRSSRPRPRRSNPCRSAPVHRAFGQIESTTPP